MIIKRAMLKRHLFSALALMLILVAGCAAARHGEKSDKSQATSPSGGPALEKKATEEAPPVRAAAATPAPIQEAFPPALAPLPPAAGSAGAVVSPVTPSAPERFISLNFDNADITVVIQTIAELLKVNYIVAPGVRGRVTIQTSERLPVSSLFAVLEQILEINALTAVKSGDFYKIVPMAQAKQEAIETLVPEAAETPTRSRLVTKVVQLKYISPAEVLKILTPFKTAAGMYQAHEPTRLLFLTETVEKIPDLMKIVEILDVDSFANIQVELYPVRYAAVDDLAKELTQIVTMVYTASGRGKTLFRIVPVAQVNGIMVFSGETGLAANIREWIAKLDQPASEANERIFVYALSHANAESLAGVLEKVFRKETKTTVKTTAQAGQQTARQAQTTTAQTGVPTPATVTPVAAGTTEAIASASAAPVTIVADKDTNSLIIQTTSWYYPVVESTIRKLDTMPKQVLIEVLIAEISLDDDNQFGLQWALKGQGNVNAFGENHSLTSQTQNVFTQGTSGITAPTVGFSFLVTESNRLTALINAYAKDSKLNVLSTPHIFATDNKEAKIDVGSEVPIVKTKTTGTAGSASTSNNTVTNDIEYRSTGVILTVTPHINEGGFVTLDVQQEVSEAQTNTLGGTDSPIIRKRTAKTTMVVKDEQTLVIGGLIQQTINDSREGIPLLSRLPILGYLFGSTTGKVSKTELVLTITPRVVMNVETGDRITQEVQDRVMTLKKGIEQFRKETR